MAMTAKEYEKRLEEVRLKRAAGEKLNKVDERVWAYRNVGRCACRVVLCNTSR